MLKTLQLYTLKKKYIKQPVKDFKSKDFCKSLNFYYGCSQTEVLKKGPTAQARAPNTAQIDIHLILNVNQMSQFCPEEIKISMSKDNDILEPINLWIKCRPEFSVLQPFSLYSNFSDLNPIRRTDKMEELKGSVSLTVLRVSPPVLPETSLSWQKGERLQCLSQRHSCVHIQARVHTRMHTHSKRVLNPKIRPIGIIYWWKCKLVFFPPS